jgi:hypothetical protein
MDAVEASLDPIFVLDKELTIRGYNAAYFQFAEHNSQVAVQQHLGIGGSFLKSLTEQLSKKLDNLFTQCLSKQETFSHNYECSSPKTFRKYRQTDYPLKNQQGFLVTNHCFISSEFEQKSANISQVHFDKEGKIT